MHWVDKMLLEYKEGRRDLRKQLKGLGDTEQDQETKSILNKMVDSMSFVIEWIETGRQPDTYRGIDKRSVYQRRYLVDMNMFPTLEIEPDNRELTNEEKEIITDILCLLSVRERECFLLSGAYQRTQEEIGEELGISRNTVKTNIERARRKINEYIKEKSLTLPERKDVV